MSTRALLDEFAQRTGWNAESMLLLVCSYIDNQGDLATFEDFLKQAEQEESDG